MKIIINYNLLSWLEKKHLLNIRQNLSNKLQEKSPRRTSQDVQYCSIANNIDARLLLSLNHSKSTWCK